MLAKKIIVTYFILLFPIWVLSQNRLTDSIIQSTSSIKPDSVRLKKISTITQALMVSNCEDAIVLANYGISQSKKINHTDLKLQFKSILGYSYKIQGDFKSSVSVFIEALSESDSLNNINRSAFIANNLGTTFLEAGKYKEAEYYFLQAIKNGLIRNDGMQLARTYTNYGYLKAELQQHDSALYFYQKALPTFISESDSVGMADNYLNMGRSLLSLLKTNDAILYFDKALFIYRVFGDYDGECRTILNKADVFVETKEYSKALDANFEALNIAQRNKSDFLIDYCYQGISDCYQLLGDYKNALNYFKKHSVLNDSLNSIEKHEQIVSLQEKYQSNLKDKKILENQIEIEQKNKQKQFFMIILIAAALVISILIFLYRKLRHYNFALEQLVKEKEFLMHEVHHRVKNNLQLLGSLFELQIRSNSNEQTKQALLDSQQRVTTIATLHSKLYKQSNVMTISLNNYLKELCEDISKTLSQNCSIYYDLEYVEINVDKCIIIGLITNEIVTNAIKHAFSDVKDPALKVVLKNKDNEILLSIIDNGKGFDGNMEELSKKSLGLKVISSLSKQLHAKLITTHEQGLGYILSFKL